MKAKVGPRSLTVTEIRQRLLAHGYLPTPNRGKVPVIAAWNTAGFVRRELSDGSRGTAAARIASWERRFPGACSTGVLIQDGKLAIDIDIADPLIEEFIPAAYDIAPVLKAAPTRHGGGQFKRALFARLAPGEEPFVRLSGHQYASGSVEVFGGALVKGRYSRQFGVHGPHSFTEDGAVAYEYRWSAHAPALWEVNAADLPVITVAQAGKICDAFDALATGAGWIPETPDASANTTTIVYDITAETRFTTNYGGDGITYTELCDEFAMYGDGLRVAANFMPGRGREENVTRCIVGDKNRHGAVGVYVFGDEQLHLPVELAPQSEAVIGEQLREWRDKILAGSSGAADAPPAAVASPGVIVATPFKWTDPAKIPPRKWLYRPHYIRSFASLTIAHSRVGKSAKVMVEALAMVTNRPLLRVRPEGKLRVWYWNGEDPRDELDRRFAAICKHYGITEEDIGDRLFVDSGRVMPIVIAEGDKSGTRVAVPVIKEVTATLITNKIDMLIVDPFVACHRVPENDNAGIERVAKSWAQIAETVGCSVMLVHHSRKSYGEDVSAESSRGASALVAAARAIQVLNTMTRKEAADLGVEEDERRRYFRNDGSESNMARPATAAEWFRLESVALGNGPFGSPGDEVGVVTAWEPPARYQTTPESAAKAWEAVKAGGPWRASAQAKVEPWVGVPIAEALGLNLRHQVNRDFVHGFIADGLRKGWLRKVEKSDHARRARDYIEAGNRPFAPPEAEVEQN